MVANPWGLYKTRKVKKAIKRLQRKTDLIKLGDEGRHSKVALSDESDSYPIPLSHGETNRFILEGLAEWLEKHGVCKKEDFLQDAK